MNTTVQTALTELLAALPRVVDDPLAPFGYGTDLWCERELDPSRDVDGLLALAQALVRRLDCRRGGLVDDADYGHDLRSELNRGTTATDVEAIAARIRMELTKDDRVASVRVVVTPSPDGSSLRVSIRVQPADPSLTSFSLTLAVTSASVLLEELARA